MTRVEREPRANEVLLDDADGLDLKTLCRCDLLFTVEKAKLGAPPRHRDDSPTPGNRPQDHSRFGHRRDVSHWRILARSIRRGVFANNIQFDF